MLVRMLQPLKDAISHHRKFTQFQKVIFCSIFVGVILSITRGWWMLLVSLTYTVTLYASVTIAKYIVKCNTFFPSDVILGVFEKLFDLLESFTKPVSSNIRSGQSIDTGAKIKDHNSAINKTKHGPDKKTLDDDHKLYDTLTSNKQNGSQNIDACIYHERTTVDENGISFEIQSIIALIKQDFIESWYKLISKEKCVLLESDTVFNHVVDCLKGRLSGANKKKLFEFILLMFKDHIHFVKEAEAMYKVQTKSRRRRSSVKPSNSVGNVHLSPSRPHIEYKSVEECFGSKTELHVAVKSTEAEHAYLTSVIEILLVHLLREDMQDSKALFSALKEILTCNVLQKVMDLLCETTFLHERIIKITSDEEICASIESIPVITVSESEPKKVQPILTQRNITNSLDESKHTSDNVMTDELEENSDKDNTFNVQWKGDIELHSVSEGLCNECNRLCSADKDRISPRPHSCSLGRTPVFFDISEDPERISIKSFNSISSTSSKDSTTSDNKHDTEVDTEQTIPDKVQEPSLSSVKRSNSSSPHEGSEFIKEGSTSSSEPPVDEKPLESPSGLDNKSSSNIFPSLKIPVFPSFPFKRPSFKSLSPTLESSASSDIKSQNKNDFRRSHSQGDFTPVSDDIQWPVERPSVFQDVRITSTETGSFGTYTLYNVEVS